MEGWGLANLLALHYRNDRLIHSHFRPVHMDPSLDGRKKCNLDAIPALRRHLRQLDILS